MVRLFDAGWRTERDMTEPTITYWLDKYGLGNDDDDIEFDREALHGKSISPELATVVLLNQINRSLKSIEIILHEQFGEK